MAKKAKSYVIDVDDPNLSAMEELVLQIEGTATLIQSRFSEKAKRQMAGKQQLTAESRSKKPARKPDEECVAAMHTIGPRPKSMEEAQGGKKKFRYGIPAAAFKHAGVRIAKTAGIPMTDSRLLFFVEPTKGCGKLVEFTSDVPYMGEDHVRITNTTDLRYRPYYDNWKCEVVITFNRNKISAQQLLAWFTDAGISNGVGEWRPGGKNSSGSNGTFKVTHAETSWKEEKAA